MPPNITATTSMIEAIRDAQYAVHAVPVQHSRAFLHSIKVGTAHDDLLFHPLEMRLFSASLWREATMRCKVFTTMQISERFISSYHNQLGYAICVGNVKSCTHN